MYLEAYRFAAKQQSNQIVHKLIYSLVTPSPQFPATALNFLSAGLQVSDANTTNAAFTARRASICPGLLDAEAKVDIIDCSRTLVHAL